MFLSWEYLTVSVLLDLAPTTCGRLVSITSVSTVDRLSPIRSPFMTDHAHWTLLTRLPSALPWECSVTTCFFQNGWRVYCPLLFLIVSLLLMCPNSPCAWVKCLSPILYLAGRLFTAVPLISQNEYLLCAINSLTLYLSHFMETTRRCVLYWAYIFLGAQV